MSRELRFVVIGAGMSGILAAIRLREAGFDDVVVYEKADRLGGTWRENTYPGLSCDVPSHFYSYSFALNPEWSHRFAPGAEIQALLRGRRAALRRRLADPVRHARCAAAPSSAGAGASRRADGSTDEADVVIAATGVLHHPAYPDIEGLDTFAGPCFHSARWDHDVPIAGKRVGVIGTGLERDPDRHGHRRRGRRAPARSSAPRSGSRRRRTPPTPTRRRRRSGRRRRRWRRSATRCRAPSPTASPTCSSTPSRRCCRRSTPAASRISRAACAIPCCARSSARPTARRASASSSRTASTRPSSAPTRRS